MRLGLLLVSSGVLRLGPTKSCHLPNLRELKLESWMMTDDAFIPKYEDRNFREIDYAVERDMLVRVACSERYRRKGRRVYDWFDFLVAICGNLGDALEKVVFCTRYFGPQLPISDRVKLSDSEQEGLRTRWKSLETRYLTWGCLGPDF